MIETAQFKNFKALRDVSLNLSPLTLIVGPNSSGKSSILEGIQFLTQFAVRHPDLVLTGPRSLSHLRSRGSSGGVALGASNHWRGKLGSIRYQEELPTSPNRSPNPQTNVTMAEGDSASHSVTYTRDGQGVQRPQVTNEPIRALGSAVHLRLDPRRLAAPSVTNRRVPRMEFDGHGLASVLDHLVGSKPDDFAQLMAAVNAVLPNVHRVRVDNARVPKPEMLHPVDGQEPEDDQRAAAIARYFAQDTGEPWGKELRFDMLGAPDLPASAVSEGTLITFALLTVMFSVARPNLILLDEMERGLHPRALKALVAQFRQVRAQFPDLQIIATTHSPYLVDCFEASEVLVASSNADGSASFATLDSHPDFPRWKSEFGTGEFWSTVGESWIEKDPGRQGV